MSVLFAVREASGTVLVTLVPSWKWNPWLGRHSSLNATEWKLMVLGEVEELDLLVIGAGFFGLYGAVEAARMGATVLVVDIEPVPMRRASLVNQARLHQGYHYPRSLSTAMTTARYFRRFAEEFESCINSAFTQVYAIARDFSYTSPEQFVRFCEAADIPCSPVPLHGLLNPESIVGAFEVEEYSFDVAKLRNVMLARLRSAGDVVRLRLGTRPVAVNATDGRYQVTLSDDSVVSPKRVINATYASVNQIGELFGVPPIDVKYELCEVVLCDVPQRWKDVGVTVMDGPFFSLMPFGRTGLHTLTSVTYTPHRTSRQDVPTFACQAGVSDCSPEQLGDCNNCPAKPATAWDLMVRLASKFLDPSIELTYRDSLFGVKAVHQYAEVDDARPTHIDEPSEQPFTSVLSGKLNSVYDLLEVVA